MSLPISFEHNYEIPLYKNPPFALHLLKDLFQGPKIEGRGVVLNEGIERQITQFVRTHFGTGFEDFSRRVRLRYMGRGRVRGKC